MGYSSGCKMGTATMVALALCTIGTIFTVYWPSMFNKMLDERLILTKGSQSYGMWEVTPIPVYIEFYFFNWTNYKEFASNHSLKPVFNEVGPYVFREHRRKVVKDWSPENSTITYFQNRTWFFEPTMSKGKLTDMIVTLNVPAVTSVHALRGPKYKWERFLLDKIMRGLQVQIWTKKTVGQFLFDGYADPLLDLAKLIPTSMMPVTIPFDKFGWFYTRNGSATYDGLFNMYTGENDVHKLGVIGEWNYETQTPFYKSYCGQLNGSAGELFPPKQMKQPLSLFNSDVCRTLDFNFEEEVQFSGINGFRYLADNTMFDNATTRPDNWCFCPSGSCPSGALDISSCKWGAPVYISFPHFFHADPWYRSTIEGMKPDESVHQTYIDLEPNSGLPMEVRAALQINVLMEPMNDFAILRGVPRIYFPAIWFQQIARITDEIGSQVRIISLMPFIGASVFYAILSAGVSILFVVAVCYVTMKFRSQEDRVILVDAD